MSEVSFNSGIETLDNLLNRTEGISHFFAAICNHALGRKHVGKHGLPRIQPSLIEIMPFTDMDNNFNYVINAYKELDGSRILLGDFVIKQVWSYDSDKEHLQLVTESDEPIIQLGQDNTVAFAAIADSYRMAHFAKNLGS